MTTTTENEDERLDLNMIVEEIGGKKVRDPFQIINTTYQALVPDSLVGDAFLEESDEVDAQENSIYYKYCSAIAEFLSQVSGWSYSNLPTFQNKLSWITVNNNDKAILAGAHFYPLLNVRNEALFVDATAQFLLTHDKKIAIVSFRGTEITNPWNWFIDATTKKVPFFPSSYQTVQGKNCKVHLGFKRNFEAVWFGSEGILRKLRHHEQEIQAVLIAGHSLGGAMAVLAGLSLQEQYPSLWKKVRGIYTYGQPMVVDSDDQEVLQKRIGKRLFRHIFYNDLVPHLPPLSVGPYDHVGDEYRYYPDTGWHLRTPPLLNIGKDRATQVLFALPTLPFLVYDVIFDNIDSRLPFTPIQLIKPKSLWSLADHNPGNYMENW